MDREFESDDSQLENTMVKIIDWVRRWPVMSLGILVLVIILGFAPTLFYQVDRDEEAVVLRFGRYVRREGPGLRWKLPAPLERVHIINTQRVHQESFGYREGANDDRYLDESLILTGDLGVARIQWDVLYRKTRPVDFVLNIREEEPIIRDATHAIMRQIVGDYNVTDVITVKRTLIATEVRQRLQEIMDEYEAGIDISNIVIQSSEPPEPVAPAFQRVDQARQEREEIRHEAQQRREKIINEAKGTADQIVAEARGDSAAMINRARGDARRFEQILREYQQAPEVTRRRMQLETMEKIIADSDRVFILDHQVRGLLPLLDLQEGIQ